MIPPLPQPRFPAPKSAVWPPPCWRNGLNRPMPPFAGPTCKPPPFWAAAPADPRRRCHKSNGVFFWQRMAGHPFFFCVVARLFLKCNAFILSGIVGLFLLKRCLPRLFTNLLSFVVHCDEADSKHKKKPAGRSPTNFLWQLSGLSGLVLSVPGIAKQTLFSESLPGPGHLFASSAQFTYWAFGPLG